MTDFLKGVAAVVAAILLYRFWKHQKSCCPKCAKKPKVERVAFQNVWPSDFNRVRKDLGSRAWGVPQTGAVGFSKGTWSSIGVSGSATLSSGVGNGAQTIPQTGNTNFGDRAITSKGNVV